MFDTEITINRFLVGYAQMMTAEIADERMTEQPVADVNHPAWILGHLAFSAELAVIRLGGEKTLAESWAKLFGPGSKLSSTRAEYPSKESLLKALEQTFDRARTLSSQATDEKLSMPNPNERLRPMLPTIRDSVAFLLTGHFGVHLGQLSAWRRMIGLPAMF